MKVVVTDYVEENLDWEAEECRRAGIEFAAFQLKFRPEAEVLARVADADVIVVNMVRFGASLVSKLTRCRLIIRHGAGYDNVDVEACTRQGIALANQPDCYTVDVAEHAIALIFACARKVVWSRRWLEESSAKGVWHYAGLFPMHRMDGMTLGIVGLGRIGARVYHKLRHFGMKIIAADPYLSEKQKAEFDVEFVDVKTLFRVADFVTIHTPLNPETGRLVDAEMLRLMKPTAYLINTSRGLLVDAAALAQALRERRIAGAALDVFDIEPPPPDHPLLGLDNVILTPHIGWASEESAQEIRRSIVNDILACSRGGTASSVVNRDALKKSRS